MASTYKAEKKTVDGVLNWYLEQTLVNYEIFAGFQKKPENGKYSYYGNDKEEGAELLEKYLRDLKTDNNTNKYSVHLISAKAKSFSPCITFQFNDDQPAAVSPYNPNNEILSRLAAIENAMQARPGDEDDDDDDDAQPEENNFLAGILNDPTMKNLLIGMVANFAGSMITKPKAIAGVETEIDNDVLSETLAALFNKGVTLNDLVKLSQMEQNQITFLLSMLRK